MAQRNPMASGKGFQNSNVLANIHPDCINKILKELDLQPNDHYSMRFFEILASCTMKGAFRVKNENIDFAIKSGRLMDLDFSACKATALICAVPEVDETPKEADIRVGNVLAGLTKIKEVPLEYINSGGHTAETTVGHVYDTMMKICMKYTTNRGSDETLREDAYKKYIQIMKMFLQMLAQTQSRNGDVLKFSTKLNTGTQKYPHFGSRTAPMAQHGKAWSMTVKNLEHPAKRGPLNNLGDIHNWHASPHKGGDKKVPATVFQKYLAIKNVIGDKLSEYHFTEKGVPIGTFKDGKMLISSICCLGTSWTYSPFPTIGTFLGASDEDRVDFLCDRKVEHLQKATNKAKFMLANMKVAQGWLEKITVLVEKALIYSSREIMNAVMEVGFPDDYHDAVMGKQALEEGEFYEESFTRSWPRCLASQYADAGIQPGSGQCVTMDNGLGIGVEPKAAAKKLERLERIVTTGPQLQKYGGPGITSAAGVIDLFRQRIEYAKGVRAKDVTLDIGIVSREHGMDGAGAFVLKVVGHKVAAGAAYLGFFTVDENITAHVRISKSQLVPGAEIRTDFVKLSEAFQSNFTKNVKFEGSRKRRGQTERVVPPEFEKMMKKLRDNKGRSEASIRQMNASKRITVDGPALMTSAANLTLNLDVDMGEKIVVQQREVDEDEMELEEISRQQFAESYSLKTDKQQQVALLKEFLEKNQTAKEMAEMLKGKANDRIMTARAVGGPFVTTALFSEPWILNTQDGPAALNYLMERIELEIPISKGPLETYAALTKKIRMDIKKLNTDFLDKCIGQTTFKIIASVARAQFSEDVMRVMKQKAKKGK